MPMDVLLKPGNRVLFAAGVLAVLVILFPPWIAMVQGGSLGMGGEIVREEYITEFLGWGALWAPPESANPTCNTIEFACWSFVYWIVVGGELLVVAAIGGLGWLFDKPKGKAA
jgi:hypothetical protein